MKTILAIDQGTHASRAMLFDQNGLNIASHWCEVELQHPGQGRVEHDPAALLKSVRSVITELLDSLNPALRKSISACGICTQRSTVLACTQTGKAISQALSWQDVRGAEFLNTLQAQHAEIQQLSGLPVSAHYGASKLHWLMQHVIKNGQTDAAYLAPLVSYLLLNLLENKPYYVDHSNAQRTQLMNMQSQQWSKPLLDWFEISANQLPTIKPICYSYGHLQNTDIPVTAVCGDQNAAVFGSGELPGDTALINLGSGAFVLRRLTKPAPGQRLLSGIAYSDTKTVDYLREGTVNGAGTALSWASKQFELGDLKQVLPTWLKEITDPPGFINTIGGLGSPWWQRDLTPQWIGDTPKDKSAIAVSIVESIVFLVQDNLQLMRHEQPLNQLRVSGGLSQLDGLCQKLADLSGLPVERMDNPEATARGVAWLAAGRPAHWQTTATDHFKPQQDTSLTERYQLFSKHLASLIQEQDKQ
jgi:glycerol kinase